ncbi:hypothetical protein D9619_002199 [Psilocybe cf. subviscida]|uniref:Rhodopsin domain-containing protein n=1 Tax=Psilocybe cf. subviscida TaxID=2480587 RepID=A0A8H5BH04_9AGAR|nr:hypothetical protein D9619_002199 [Psilocybe cf. subviscida]
MPVQVPHQSYIVWKVCVTILHCVAIAVSAFRIWLRYRSSRVWWDDYLVVVPMLFDIFYCVTLLAIPPPGPSLESIVKASNYWLSLFPSFTVAWLTRICFLLLLARLFPPRHIYRRITLGLTAIFSLTYLTLIALSVPRCDGVHLVPPPGSLGKRCKMAQKISARLVFGLTTDLLSDLILVVWPLLMLYRVKLSRPKDRPLVIVSLGCSIFTFLLIVAIVVFSWGPITIDNNYYIVVCMLAHMTAAVSLIACNMPVVACAAYRALQRARGVPLGTVVEMPDASNIHNPGGQSGPALYSSSSSVSKGTSTGDSRLTYEDLTRISMSFEMSDISCTSPTTTPDPNQNSSGN